MPKARAKSPAPRQRRPSEWNVLSRYLRQMTGHDLDSYARLVAVLKDRFSRLDAREVWDRYGLRKVASGWKWTGAATIRPTSIKQEGMALITSPARSRCSNGRWLGAAYLSGCVSLVAGKTPGGVVSSASMR
jgi:hypothetical protein